MTAVLSEDVVARLDELVAEGGLPGRARDYGQDLLQRLRAPVRVVVAGPARSGKSRLIELLAGGAPQAPGDGAAPACTPSAVIDNLVLIEQAAAARRGSPIADSAPHIVLWCTQGFAHDEADAWAEVPDGMKDHAFLVLTKADELIRLGVLQERLDDLREVVESEFHSLLPIATSQALVAWSGSRLVDETAHARSGAKALFDALERMVAQGRRADLDAAELFLRRHGGLAAGRPAADTAGAAPIPAAPTPSAAGRAETAAPDRDAPAPRPPDPDAEISDRALRLLDEYRDDFPDEIRADDATDLAALLALCARVAEALNALVADIGDVSEDLSEDVFEANETMILLALEETASAAADAVTLILQLRRGFETRLAA